MVNSVAGVRVLAWVPRVLPVARLLRMLMLCLVAKEKSEHGGKGVQVDREGRQSLAVDSACAYVASRQIAFRSFGHTTKQSYLNPLIPTP
jgi:hypothetical protein